MPSYNFYKFTKSHSSIEYCFLQLEDENTAVAVGIRTIRSDRPRNNSFFEAKIELFDSKNLLNACVAFDKVLEENHIKTGSIYFSVESNKNIKTSLFSPEENTKYLLVYGFKSLLERKLFEKTENISQDLFPSSLTPAELLLVEQLRQETTETSQSLLSSQGLTSAQYQTYLLKTLTQKIKVQQQPNQVRQNQSQQDTFEEINRLLAATVPLHRNSKASNLTPSTSNENPSYRSPMSERPVKRHKSTSPSETDSGLSATESPVMGPQANKNNSQAKMSISNLLNPIPSLSK